MIKRAFNEPVTAEEVLIFLRIPKTAGLTLNRIIDRQFPHDTIFSFPVVGGPELNEFKSLSKREKQKIRCLRGHIAFGLHQWLPKPSIYITLLRDPVDRLISEYYYLRHFSQSSLPPVYKELMSEDISLHDYARIYTEWRANNLQTRWISGCVDMNDLMPPYDPLPMEALQTAKQNLSIFGVVGLTESFDESLLLMKRFFGWRNVFYTRKNVTPGRPSKSEISRKTIGMIEDSNRLDLELYEFVKQEFEELIREQGARFENEVRNFQMLNKVCAQVWKRFVPQKAKALVRSITA